MDQKKKQTPSQTIGPFFAYGLTPEQYNYEFNSLCDNEMAKPRNPDAITIVGKVFDGNSQPIDDAMVEIWQNDGKNKLFGRFGTGTDPEKRFIFHTIKPNPIDGQAPFLILVLFMRGQLIHSYTRVYFSDEKEMNEKDDLLNTVPKERRKTLIARKKNDFYEFNIHMQGENETVFFEL